MHMNLRILMPCYVRGYSFTIYLLMLYLFRFPCWLIISIAMAGLLWPADYQCARCLVRRGWALLKWLQQDTPVRYSYIPSYSHLAIVSAWMSTSNLVHLWCSRTTATTKCLNLGSYNYLGFAAADEYCTPRVIESLKKYSASTCSVRADGGCCLFL